MKIFSKIRDISGFCLIELMIAISIIGIVTPILASSLCLKDKWIKDIYDSHLAVIILHNKLELLKSQSFVGQDSLEQDNNILINRLLEPKVSVKIDDYNNNLGEVAVTLNWRDTKGQQAKFTASFLKPLK
ncbi:MAG: type II secretion system protein [bacterium]